jgi:prepilin-type N-terminal cleavage/methylation domain-containing protein
MHTNQQGFNLLELIIVITIMIGIGGAALCGLSYLHNNNQRHLQITALTQDIATTQQIARSYHHSTILCGSKNGKHCDGD